MDPEYQGQGIAKMLLDWGVEQADKDGSGIYLEGTKMGMGLYERAGFREKGEVRFPGIKGQDGEEYVIHLMVREGRAG